MCNARDSSVAIGRTRSGCIDASHPSDRQKLVCPLAPVMLASRPSRSFSMRSVNHRAYMIDVSTSDSLYRHSTVSCRQRRRLLFKHQRGCHSSSQLVNRRRASACSFPHHSTRHVPSSVHRSMRLWTSSHLPMHTRKKQIVRQQSSEFLRGPYHSFSLVAIRPGRCHRRQLFVCLLCLRNV